MLLERPVEHLQERHRQEQVRAKALRRDRERQPAQGLPEVVGAGDFVEAPAFGDAALGGAGLAQIAKGHVAHEVHKLKHPKGSKEAHLNLIRRPSRRRILRVQQEVDSSQPHQYPVVRAILKHIEEWHGIIREPVNKQRLQLPLQVVAQYHS